MACTQLAQTSLRSAIGKMELDRTFEEREAINAEVVSAIDEAAGNWGVKVLRYEISDITPPQSVMHSMEKQMQAEREKRASIATSEGDRQARINRAEGLKREAIEISEGEKQKRINEAMGQAEEIRLVSEATAEGIAQIARSLQQEGGDIAANLRVAEKYIAQWGHLAKENNSMIIPANMADMGSLVATAMAIVNKSGNSTKKASQST